MCVCVWNKVYKRDGGRDSVVDTATVYALDGSGFETLWERGFPHPSTPAPKPTHLPVQWVLRLCDGTIAVGTWCSQPTQVCRSEVGNECH